MFTFESASGSFPLIVEGEGVFRHSFVSLVSLNYSFSFSILITMAHQVRLRAAGGQYGVPRITARSWLQKYWTDGQVGRL
jgi:hypothetical protein